VESRWPAWRPTHLRCWGAGSGEHPCGKVAGGEGAGGVEDVWLMGEPRFIWFGVMKPFVAGGEDVVG